MSSQFSQMSRNEFRKILQVRNHSPRITHTCENEDVLVLTNADSGNFCALGRFSHGGCIEKLSNVSWRSYYVSGEATFPVS